jgi:hypothetical protein
MVYLVWRDIGYIEVIDRKNVAAGMTLFSNIIPIHVGGKRNDGSLHIATASMRAQLD